MQCISDGKPPLTPDNVDQWRAADQYPYLEVCQGCWRMEPSSRPSMYEVEQYLIQVIDVSMSPLMTTFTVLRLVQYSDRFAHLDLTNFAKPSSSEQHFVPSPFLSPQIYPEPTLEYVLKALEPLKRWMVDLDLIKVVSEGAPSQDSLRQVSKNISTHARSQIIHSVI